MKKVRSNLWAPWRLEYILAGKKKGKTNKVEACPFCELPAQTPSEKNLVLYRDKDIFVIMNKFPYNNGHLLVCPRKHAERPSDLNKGDWQQLSRALELCIDICQKSLAPQGYNVGLNLGRAAGAGIAEHLHWHIIPRWGGDTNFMPTVAETKCIPVHLKTVYRQMKPLFSGFSEKLAKAKIKS
jgi:ATP adenylyltransferase